ncbi:ABC transporter ATP-binding protein [Microvirga sp. ACRRW]|uniref:ABC transporter ATP-binding protein n=1 Tax=Microvirga sp. ACRRW TaxID=2918205 RepID=UPI001EF6BB53|nr:ABC transporter ATP-binding protein [Microvirga sp. ACRRW]MCG7392877.1 ABC transporter ATP-binding protein [Microvirga sp. ACRRW]
MERDPLRLAWKVSPYRHILGFGLLVLAGILLIVGLELIRTVVDRAVAGGSAAPGTLLRIAVTPPASLWQEPLVLFPGIPLAPETFVIASIGGILLVPILIALLLIPLDGIAVSIGSRALAKLRALALDAILKAPPSLQDDLSTATALAAHGLARENSVLGLSLFVPVKLGGMIGLCFAYVLVMDWSLGAALAVVLSLGAILNARRALLRFDATTARHKEGQVAEGILAGLEHRIPAMRAHGTGFYERDRVRNLLIEGHRPVARREYRLALVDSTAAIVLMLAPVVVLALGAWFAQARPLTAGMVASCALASALAAYGVREIVQWQRMALRARALLSDVARTLAALKPRDVKKGKASLPDNGALVAQGVSAYDTASGARITGVNLNLTFPSHVALVGDGDSGPRLLAALMSGQLHPSVGRITYGGVDLVEANPFERSQRIALAGDTVLIEGSLRENLLYGCHAPAEEREHRLWDAITVAGLDRLTHARGLSGTLDPKREPEIAAAIVEARRFVQATLREENLDRFVDPFDAARYNRYATIGENLLFGQPVGDTFQQDRLSAHPFVRAILEANDLNKTLSQIGLSIATSMVEIFTDIPDGHPLFERFSFFSASDRPYFQDLVERQSGLRRPGRDQERLIGLALRYNESRHRLGLLNEALEARILTARSDFSRMLPLSLRPAIEFYDQAQFCTAASVQDNLLFGRIAADQAGAPEAVQGVIRRVLTERGLDGEVSRIGLDLPIDVQGDDLSLTEIAAVDLVRCLVRRPSILVVQRALDGLPSLAADRLVAALRRSMVGRGLVIVTPTISSAMDQPSFDAVIRFERGEPVLVPSMRQPEALSA